MIPVFVSALPVSPCWWWLWSMTMMILVMIIIFLARIPVLVSATCQCLPDQNIHLGPGAFLPPINTSSLTVMVVMMFMLTRAVGRKTLVIMMMIISLPPSTPKKTLWPLFLFSVQGCASVHLLTGLVNLLGNLEELVIRDVAEVTHVNILYLIISKSRFCLGSNSPNALFEQRPDSQF